MKIVIVGGGAGGLELASKLGNTLGRKGKAEVLLLDRSPTHVWKPLLHEVASGSLDPAVDSVSYRAHAYQNHFTFKLGTLCGVDAKRKLIQLSAITESDDEEILPHREEHYDYLVLAIGSVSNDFSVDGVDEHCIFLDAPEQAELFHERLLNRFISLNRRLAQGDHTKDLHIAIVGGGATGVELSAELFKAREWCSVYGLNHIQQKHLRVSLIEAGPRLLPALNEKISSATHVELAKLGVNVLVNTAVLKAEKNTLVTGDNQKIEADLMVWAAGVKAPDFLQNIDGLTTNRVNQLIVEPSLLVKGNNYIFALGDCAGCKIDSVDSVERWVPPRAQSAHQMASLVAKNIHNLIKGKPLEVFSYKDYGSLVSLSDYTAFGTLMGGIAGGRLQVAGRIARLSYVSLYRFHQVAIHGWFRTVLITLSDKINRFIRPKLKLH